MTLKEIRIIKGLTQSECASYLGISLRSYKSYENDLDKQVTLKYKVLCSKLISYNKNGLILNEDVGFNTNVVIGEKLLRLYKEVELYKKRDCYKYLKRYIDGKYIGKVCILYGLRRTGKTTMLFQLIGELNKKETAYIKIDKKDNMSLLLKDIKLLNEMGYKNILIDEITLMSDFIDCASVLSDVYSMLGMKIVMSGTDSLGFLLADRDELYDRNIMIHTSFISFKEYSFLLNINSIDKYIEYGGTLKKENMNFDDEDYLSDEVSFKNDESTRKYIDSSIARNIQHSLKNDNLGIYFNELRELYENNELTNAINRIIEDMNHRFLIKVIEDEYKSKDLGSSKNLLLKEVPLERAFILKNIDLKEVIQLLKRLIEIKERDETKVKVLDSHISKIKFYLFALDLIYKSEVIYESGMNEEYIIFVQPGMRYSITKGLVYSLLKDKYFSSVSNEDRNYIIDKILSDVKGRMLEDIVLLEVNKKLSKDKKVFKYKFNLGGEFDMVIYDSKSNTCEIYEIKHSNKIDSKQTRFLNDNNKCDTLEKIYGRIIGKYVLYRGDKKVVGDIQYLNVEEYLLNLK